MYFLSLFQLLEWWFCNNTPRCSGVWFTITYWAVNLNQALYWALNWVILRDALIYSKSWYSSCQAGNEEIQGRLLGTMKLSNTHYYQQLCSWIFMFLWTLKMECSKHSSTQPAESPCPRASCIKLSPSEWGVSLRLTLDMTGHHSHDSV